MTEESLERLISDLKERAKELSCLYEVQEILSDSKASQDDICMRIVKAIPPGWQYPDICQVKISVYSAEYKSEGFVETAWNLCNDLTIQEKKIGYICVSYSDERPPAYSGPFLKEELKLIETIAEQFGHYLLHKHLQDVFEQQMKTRADAKNEWSVILDLLRSTDTNLLIRVSRKMVNFLCWTGVSEAEALLEHFSPGYQAENLFETEKNSPFEKKQNEDLLPLSNEIFEVAGKHLSEEEILGCIQKWIKEDRSGFLVHVLEDTGSSLADISGAIERYHHLTPQGLELSLPREMSFRVSLIRRFFSDQADFINIAKKFICVNDFNDLIQRVIFPVGSHGKLGGKSAGLFLAQQILKNLSKVNTLFKDIKTPKTWYLTSDSILDFMNYNNLEEIIEQKYKDVGQIRQEYPYIIHVFKNSQFTPEIIKGLSIALDDFGDVPLIVRSSSLLEDRLGSAFAGKYKSLFIANQGSKEDRLLALLDAIAEVYASTFGPDPLEYRARQDLLDYHEEMGILIQEVVGKKVGDYFLPAFAGVAFSSNEFRWSSRIKREDGLIRMVPGMGTRAVDRLSDDYPILIAPGQSKLRVNVTMDEIIRYSPKFIDVINLKKAKFETIKIHQLIKECGKDYPFLNQIASVLKEDRIQQIKPMWTDFEKDSLVFNFDGLIDNTPFVQQIKSMMDVLKEAYNTPVDIEFAHDGENLHLLQCRSQSYGIDSNPADIPTDIAKENIIFSAKRYISNGFVANISHIVYVNHHGYGQIKEHKDLIAVGRAVGRLNKILPKRQFILMGPGRWGSRGDIKLGVSITYSDINNTAMLIEIARKYKDYVPDLSFGTHFFLDLVESNIRYLPLYPDDENIIFHEAYLKNSENILPKILPDFAYLADVITVIDVSDTSKGKLLQIYMNADQEEAIAVLDSKKESVEESISLKKATSLAESSDVHWRWRKHNMEGLAAKLDPEKYGVKALYIFGSTKNGTAGPGSDIDLLIHFVGTEAQKKDLSLLLEGWSQSMSLMNFMKTGVETDGLLDVHFVTDEDIKKKTSYASKIGAVTDAAMLLPMGSKIQA